MFLRKHVKDKTEAANILVDKFRGIPDSQAGLLVLMHCANYAKLVYLSRVLHPDLCRQELAAHDTATRDSLGTC